MSSSIRHLGLRPAAIAAAALLVLSPPAAADAVVGGTVQTRLAGSFASGAGNFLLPTDEMWVGLNQAGSLALNGGSQLVLDVLSVSQNGGRSIPPDGVSRLDLTGAGTVVAFHSVGIGEWGSGVVTVTDGALLNGRLDGNGCPRAFCNMLLGNTAGSTAVLTISGAGAEARLRPGFTMASAMVHTPATSGFYLGTPGGSTSASVEVLAGGLLRTYGGNIGAGPGGAGNGQERTFASVVLDGAGSLWRVENTGSGATNLSLATHRIATATVDVRNGARMAFQGGNGIYSPLNVSPNAGRATLSLTGAGSGIDFSGDATLLQIGTGNGGVGAASVTAGATITGLWYSGVGRNGGTGNLLVDGAGSVMTLSGTASAAANTVTGTAVMEVGRNGGNGTVTVSNGARLELLTSTGATNGTSLGLARDATSSGTLTIASGGVVQLRSTSSAPGTAAETPNPVVIVGRDGSGFLNVSGGGQLLLDGGAVSTLTDRRSTSFYVGGRGDAFTGGRGMATVTGAGSEVRVTGQDTFIGVGIGAQSSGLLTVRDLAQVNGMGIAVGRSGGVGVLKVDNAALNFSGQQTAGNQSGAFFVIGSGGSGIGTAVLSNNSRVVLTNLGSAGAGVSIGGSGAFAGGDGSLVLEGGSRIEIRSQPGLNSVTVGREGTGFLRLRGASSLDQADGVMQIARNGGSIGAVHLSEASTITAGWVGVGARKTDTGDADGGIGSLVLVNSTLNASTIVIGTNGFLGGTGTINGQVTNRGIFAPGNSPGRLEINGGFVAEAGSRLILEVESDGQGGFRTDELVFNAGQPLDLGGLAVEFRFLGTTDPNAFKASGRFDTDTFFQVKAADGSLGVLAPSFFSQVSYEASAEGYTISNFSFDAATGAGAFTAAAVPEPTTNALLLAGLLSLGWLARRRRA